MENFVAVLHLLVALLLITIVLLQDSKGGATGGAFGGGGSNSVLGATGAATLAQKITRWVAAIFAVTCIALTIQSARGRTSVVDAMAATPAPSENANAAAAASSTTSSTSTTTTAPSK